MEDEKFEVYLFASDGQDDEDEHRYTTEHWFTDRPGSETVAALFEEAKRDYATLYPGVEPTVFSVYVHRIPTDSRPAKPDHADQH